MERITQQLDLLWSRWIDLVASEPLLVAAISAGLVVVLIGAVVLGRLVRRRRTAPPARGERDELVRRPAYLDSVVVSDVLAHLEANDHGRDLRVLLDDHSEDELRTPQDELVSRRDDQVRSLNKAIAAVPHRPGLAVDLDTEPDAEVRPGQVVRLTGSLKVLPASRVATLLERGVPLYGRAERLQPASSRHDDDTDTGLLVLERTSLETSEPAIVAEFQAPHVSQQILLILDADAMAREDVPRADVSMLAIVDRVLGRRDRLDLNDFIRPHLSLQARSALGSRHLMDVAEPLAKAADADLRRRDLKLKGPAFTVTPAAIWG